MRRTGESGRDGAVAATVALAVNVMIAWSLQALLSPYDFAVDDQASLQVVLITTAPRRPSVIAPAARPATKAPAAPVADRPLPTSAVHTRAIPAPALDIIPSRPLTAVYLQQARQWAQQHPAQTVPADPFANRPVALAQQPGSRFRLSRPVAPADAVAMMGQLFGGAGYTTDDCALIRRRIVGLVAGGDAQAVQQDLDYERRHCRP